MDEKKRKSTKNQTVKKLDPPSARPRDKSMRPKGDLTRGLRSPQSGTPGASNPGATGGSNYSV